MALTGAKGIFLRCQTEIVTTAQALMFTNTEQLNCLA